MLAKLCSMNVDGVIVVSGNSYADTISASGLAGLLRYPVMYSSENGLCDQAMDFLDDRRPSRIIVIGGTAAVSDEVTSTLEGLPYVEQLERIGGADRYETASGVYAYGAINNAGWGSGDAIIVAGENFPDAVSIAPYASFSRSPVFLAREGSLLDDEVVNACAAQDRVILVGGPDAVSADVEGQISQIGIGVIRLAGANRYATNMEVVQFCLRGDYQRPYEPPSDVFGFTDYVATGGSFADALSVGIAASIRSYSPAIVYLVDDCEDARENIEAMPARGGFVYLNTCFIGGQQAVSQEVRADIEAAIRANTPAEFR